MSLTIFLATYNRIDTLKRSIESLAALDTPYQLCLIDNGSDAPEAIETLAWAAKRPETKKVYSLGKVTTMDELTANYNIALKDQYKGWSDWYVVTDADICFEDTNPDAINVYHRLARIYNCAIGPHLRLHTDISHGYPLRSKVLATETRPLYRHWMDWDEGVPHSPCKIDTTFHLFPAEPEHRRLAMPTRRVGPPCDALHLDWNLDIFHPTNENRAYINASLGSWGARWISHYWTLFQASPEGAFEHLRDQAARGAHGAITEFILSWAYQMGAGCEPDHGHSLEYLSAAMAQCDNSYQETRDDWRAMIYHNDFRSLGWS